MGRVKKYAGGAKHRRSKSLIKKRESTDEMVEQADDQVHRPEMAATASLAKRKQIFKKSKDGRRELKRQILELKRQSSKLRKRNLDQKSEKKRISKQIK